MIKKEIFYVGFVLILSLVFNGCVSEDVTTLEDCNQYKNNPDLMYECFSKVGVKQLNTSICDKIPSENLFKYLCYADIALEKNDSSICEKLGEDKNLCYEQIAHECSCLYSDNDKYTSVCDEVKQKGYKGACE